MKDHDLVPVCALGIDGDPIRRDKFSRQHVIGDIWIGLLGSGLRVNFNYQIKISDPTGVGSAISSVLSYDLGQALQVLSSYIDGLGALTVNLDFTQTSTGRFDGRPAML